MDWTGPDEERSIPKNLWIKGRGEQLKRLVTIRTIITLMILMTDSLKSRDASASKKVEIWPGVIDDRQTD